jgi:hypothetical protein
MTLRFPIWTTLAVAFATVLAVPARADIAKSLGTSGAWRSYMYASGTGKVCYATSQPKTSRFAPDHRGDVRLTVSDRTDDRSVGVISVTEGYPFKKDASAELDVDGVKFDLYTSDDSAWAHDDKAVVQAMLKGTTTTVYGVPAKGWQSVDTYSLDGFAKAFAEVGRACGVK